MSSHYANRQVEVVHGRKEAAPDAGFAAGNSPPSFLGWLVQYRMTYVQQGIGGMSESEVGAAFSWRWPNLILSPHLSIHRSPAANAAPEPALQSVLGPGLPPEPAAEPQT